MSALLGQGDGNADVVSVTAADVVPAPGGGLPPSRSFEELEVPAAFRAAAEAELADGEHILWVGRPSRNPAVHPRKNGLVMAGFGLIALAVCIAAGSFLMLGTKELFPLIFAGALGIIGSAFLLPLLVDPSKSCRACYVVTDRRAILLQQTLYGGAPRAKSYQPHQLAGMERRDHAEVPGAGDLIFEYTFALPGHSFDLKSGTMFQQGDLVGRGDKAQRVPVGFFCLDSVRQVEGLIRTRLLGQAEEAPQAPAAGPNDRPLVTAYECGAGLEGPGGLAGQWVKCPRCAAVVKVGATAGPSRAAAARYEGGAVPADLEQKALAGLDANEAVVWLGQPDGQLVLLRGLPYFVASGLGVLISAAWLFLVLTPPAANVPANQKAAPRQQARGKFKTAPQQPAPNAAAQPPGASGNVLFPLGALVASLCVGGVPLLRWRTARRTCYVLTDRRAVVYKEGLFGPTRESYPPHEVARMRTSKSWLVSGGGDLVFSSVTVVTRTSGPGGGRSEKTTDYGFLALADVAAVERVVRDTLIDRFVDRWK